MSGEINSQTVLVAGGFALAFAGRALLEHNSDRGLLHSLSRGLVSDGLLGASAGGALGFIANERTDYLEKETVEGMIIGGLACSVLGFVARVTGRWMMAD